MAGKFWFRNGRNHQKAFLKFMVEAQGRARTQTRTGRTKGTSGKRINVNSRAEEEGRPRQTNEGCK